MTGFEGSAVNNAMRHEKVAGDSILAKSLLEEMKSNDPDAENAKKLALEAAEMKVAKFQKQLLDLEEKIKAGGVLTETYKEIRRLTEGEYDEAVKEHDMLKLSAESTDQAMVQ